MALGVRGRLEFLAPRIPFGLLREIGNFEMDTHLSLLVVLVVVELTLGGS